WDMRDLSPIILTQHCEDRPRLPERRAAKSGIYALSGLCEISQSQSPDPDVGDDWTGRIRTKHMISLEFALQMWWTSFGGIHLADLFSFVMPSSTASSDPASKKG